MEYRMEEYTTTPIAFVCSSSPSASSSNNTNNLIALPRYYFLEEYNDDQQHLPSKYDPIVTHAVCLVKSSDREGFYNEGVTVAMKVKMLKLNSLFYDDGYLGKKHFFNFWGKQTPLKYGRYDFTFKQVLVNGHPSTNNGTVKEFDYYCGSYAQRITIELDQKDIERSKLEVTVHQSIFNETDNFYHLNSLIVKPFIKYDMFLMFQKQKTTLKIQPTFLKYENDSIIRDEFNISPMPFDCNDLFLRHSTILSRLDASEKNYLIINYKDHKRKNYHLIRELNFETIDEKQVGKLSRCDFRNFFKYFNEKMQVIGDCRLNETCFLYKLAKLPTEKDTLFHYTYLEFDGLKEFATETKWVLIDLKDLSVQEIQPYTMKLLTSSASSYNVEIDEDGFIIQQKPQKRFFASNYTNKKDPTMTRMCDFSQLSLSSYRPFPHSNPSLVNVLCTVLVGEQREHSRKNKTLSTDSVIYINYQFKMKEIWKDKLLEKASNGLLSDVIFKLQKVK